MAADHVGKDVAGVHGDDDRSSKVSGEDLEHLVTTRSRLPIMSAEA